MLTVHWSKKFLARTGLPDREYVYQFQEKRWADHYLKFWSKNPDVREVR